MTVTLKHNGDLVLEKKGNEKVAIKSGDHYIVTKAEKGRVVLRPADLSSTSDFSRNSYLNPRPVSHATLARLYSTPDPIWDNVESEAVSHSKKLLKGKRLQDL